MSDRIPFSAINRERCESPNGFNHKLEYWSLSDWMVALLGELGEAANIVKKLNRIRDGIPNTKGETRDSLRAELQQELADADIYLDLVYQRAGINRTVAVMGKFNDTSNVRGLSPYHSLMTLTPMEGRRANQAQPAEQAPSDKVKDYVDGRFYAHEDPPKPAAPAIHPSPDEFTEAELAADPILRFFHYKHLPPVLREVSAPFCQQARGMIDRLPRNAERTVALRKLLEAKDCAVRASLPTP